MGDGKFNRAMEQGKARTNEIKGAGAGPQGRGADLKERVPEFRERGAELTARSAEELKNRGAELRTKGTELRARGGELARQYAKMDVSWARCGYARAAARRAAQIRARPHDGLLPPPSHGGTRRLRGADAAGRLRGEPLQPSRHATILRAIPRKWRNRTAVAAAADYFYKKRWKANGVALLFNTVPLGRNGGGLGNGATDHVDRLIGQRWNLLMFPEGTRSRDGEIGKVHSGAAVIAAHHGIDIVPIYVSGTHDAMPPGQNWPKRRPGRFLSRRHKVEVRFGRPIRSRDEEHRREVMDEVRAFWERKGLPAEPTRLRLRRRTTSC